MKATNGKRGCIGMKRRKLRSAPKDPLETDPSIKEKADIVDDTSSSSLGKELIYAEVIQGSSEAPSESVKQDSATATFDAYQDSTNSETLSPERYKDSSNSKLPPEKDTNLEIRSVVSTEPQSSTSEVRKVFIKSELLSSTSSIKNNPKLEPNLSSDLTQDIIPNDFIRFSDEMQTRIMTRHPKAKPEDAEELLNLLKAEFHENNCKDHSYSKMKPMPLRRKLMHNAKNCFVKLEILRNKKDFNFDLKREATSEFSGFREQGFPFDQITPMAPMTSPVRSSRGGRVLKMRFRAEDMLYYQADHTSQIRGRCPPVTSGTNTSRGRAGKKRSKIKSPLFNQLVSAPTDTFIPCPLPVPFAQIAQISSQKPKRAYNKKMKTSPENSSDDCFIIKNLIADSEHPSFLATPLETPPANNDKEIEVPTGNPSENHNDKGYDGDVSYSDKFSPLITDCRADQPNSTKESSPDKSKRTYKKRNKAADVIDLAYKALIKEEDECDVIGNLVTMKLRNILKINPTMKILAEKLINETIFEAEMGTLTPYHSIVMDHAQSYSPGIDHNVGPYPCNFDQSVQTFPYSVNHAPPPPPHLSSLPPHLPSLPPHLPSLPPHLPSLPPHLPPPPCTSSSQNSSTFSQNPPGVSFNFNQNLSYYSPPPPPVSDHQPHRHSVRTTDRHNNFMSL